MKRWAKLSLTLVVAASLVFTASVAFAGGTKEGAQEPSQKRAEIEQGKAEQAKGTYATYEMYLQHAKDGTPFPGAPGKGKKLAFANIVASFPFCQSVEKNIIEVALLAGFAREDLIILDNQVDATIGLQNADIILAKKPDGFLEFQIDAKVNAIVGRKFAQAGIPVIAIDVEVPGAPFVGVDNYGASYQTGEWIIKQIEGKWGGQVDLVILGATETAGEAVMLRALGTKDALIDKYGQSFAPKIELQHVGSTADSAQPVVASILAKHPAAKKLVISTVNDQTIRGAISAVQAAGTLKREDIIFVALGCDDSGIEMLRNKEIDGDLAYFPEHYGRYCVSGIVAMMQKEPVPPYMFVENVMITPDNVDQHYPR
jgi:ABC-type sugar transport system substrate-binding protein